LGRSKRSYPIYNPNSNADLFIDDDEDAERRSKRAADPSNTENNRRNNQEIKIEPYKFQQRESYSDNRSNRGRSSNRNNQRYSNSGNIRNDNSREPSLDKLIKEIKQKVKDTKKFWSNLPYSACNNEELPTAGNSDSCWNGQSVNRYENQHIFHSFTHFNFVLFIYLDIFQA
jgi:glypican 4